MKNSYIDIIKKPVKEEVYNLGVYVKEYILENFEKKDLKWVFLTLHYLYDCFQQLKTKMEYTKFIGKIADSSKYIDYHELDKFVQELVKDFYRGLGKDYKNLYKVIKTGLWIGTHTKIGRGVFPRSKYWDYLEEPYSSDSDPMSRVEKIWYAIINWKW